MDFEPRYQSPLGYRTGNNGIDSYGVNHKNFSLRDELEYQLARHEREQRLMDGYNARGINKNYPQFGTDFWGNPENNYGFGLSNVAQNIAQNQLKHTSGTPIFSSSTSDNHHLVPLTDNTITSSRYNHDCSFGGIVDNFLKIRKDAAVEKPLTTGTIIGDWILTQIPGIGKGINAYNKGTFIGSNISHAINAYNESCNHAYKK